MTSVVVHNRNKSLENINRKLVELVTRIQYLRPPEAAQSIRKEFNEGDLLVWKARCKSRTG